MIQWSLTNVLDEQACSDWLQQMEPTVWPALPTRPSPRPSPHDRHRGVVVDYRCRQCGAVFTLFTGPLFAKTRYPAGSSC